MSKKKILVFGGSGLVGSRFTTLCKNSFEINAPDATYVDILKSDQLLKFVSKSDAEVIINFAAFTQVEAAEKEKGDKEGLCYKLNALGSKNVADVCKRGNKKLIHISTEYVFDGTKSDGSYQEEDKPNPINWYGATKFFGEKFVLESGCNFTLVRISMPFSAKYELKKDVARFFFGQLKNKIEINAIADQKITPTLTDDIASALAVLVNKKNSGIYHVSSKNPTTPFGFARLIAKIFNLDSSLIKPIQFDEYNVKKQAKLLRNSSLDPAKFEREFGKTTLHTIEEEVKLVKSQLI